MGTSRESFFFSVSPKPRAEEKLSGVFAGKSLFFRAGQSRSIFGGHFPGGKNPCRNGGIGSARFDKTKPCNNICRIGDGSFVTGVFPPGLGPGVGGKKKKKAKNLVPGGGFFGTSFFHGGEKFFILFLFLAEWDSFRRPQRLLLFGRIFDGVKKLPSRGKATLLTCRSSPNRALEKKLRAFCFESCRGIFPPT